MQMLNAIPQYGNAPREEVPFTQVLMNMQNMQKAGAARPELDAYLQSVGHTPDSFTDAWKQYQSTQPSYQRPDWQTKY